MDWNTFWDTVSGWLLSTGVRIVISIIILLVSFRLITLLSRWLARRMQKHHVDKTVFGALIHIGGIGLKCVVVVCLVGYFFTLLILTNVPMSGCVLTPFVRKRTFVRA